MIGQIFGLGLPGVGMVLSIAFVLFEGITTGRFSDWQLIVVAFAAGGLAMQQRQILNTMVTKADLSDLRMELSQKYQTKVECATHHRGRAAGAGGD